MRLYRITRSDGIVFGSDGTDQAKNGMPIPDAEAMREGTYWLTRVGWETFGQPMLVNAWERGENPSVEERDEPYAPNVLYRDLFQTIVKKRSPKPGRTASEPPGPSKRKKHSAKKPRTKA